MHNLILFKFVLGIALILAPEPIVTTLMGIAILAFFNKSAKANINISEPLN